MDGPPKAGRLKSPQPMPYAQIGCRGLRRESAGTGGAWHDFREVTIKVYGLKADVVRAVTALNQLFNPACTLTYPSGIRFVRWWSSTGDDLDQDPQTKAGQDVWVATVTGEVWSIREDGFAAAQLVQEPPAAVAAGITAALPDIPTGLVAVAGSGSIGLSWDAAAGADTYNVHRSLTSNDEVLLAGGIADVRYSDATAAIGTLYYYKVSAVNDGGESVKSNEASARIFTPTDAPGLLVWLKRDTGFFSDTAGTTPVSVQGDNVQRWSDASGNGKHATQATAGNKCHLNLHAWGTKALYLRGITNFLSTAGTLSVQQNACSVYVRFQMQDTCQAGGIVCVADDVAHELWIQNNNGQLVIRTDSVINTGLTLPVDTDCTVSLISGSGGGHVNLNGTSVAVSGAAANTLNRVILGSRQFGSPNSFPNAIIMEVLVYSGAHDAATEAALRTYLAAPAFTRRFSLDFPLIIFDGNSIVAGSGASTPDKAFVYKTMAALASTVQYANLGISAQKIKAYGGGANQMTENRPTKVDAYFDSRRAKNILNALEMVNSEAGAGSGAQLKADWQAYLAGAKTANSFIQTIAYNDAPPNAGSTGADANTALNADFTGGTADTFVFSPAGGITYADREIRVAAMTITRPDTVHPNDAGHLTMSTSNIAALSQLGVT